MKSKPELRREVLERVKEQGLNMKAEKDKIIGKRLSALPDYKNAKYVAFYHSFAGEVDTRTLIEEALALGKRVGLPVVAKNDMELREIRDAGPGLKKGPFGIMEPDKMSSEPFSGEKLDVIIVPGVAFTAEGARLGRGKGFYDRFLKTLPSGVKKIALAYDCQIVDNMPTAAHDVPVDIVVSN